MAIQKIQTLYFPKKARQAQQNYLKKNEIIFGDFKNKKALQRYFVTIDLIRFLIITLIITID